MFKMYFEKVGADAPVFRSSAVHMPMLKRQIWVVQINFDETFIYLFLPRPQKMSFFNKIVCTNVKYAGVCPIFCLNLFGIFKIFTQRVHLNL